MGNLIIKGKGGAGNKLIIQDQAGAAVLTTTDSGATMASTVTDIPAAGVTGVLPVGVTGGSGLNNLPNKHNKCISKATFAGFNSTGVNPINNSWAIANIGNSDEVMTQSAGIFTFPSTGIWRLETRASVYNSTATAFNCEGASFDTYESTNGGGSWAHIIAAHNHITFPANDWYRTPLYGSAILDVTNTSSYKIKFACGTNPSANLHWSWSGTNSCILFLKMGPT